jgi:O-acetylserine/cysteine efflux transporter
VYKALVLLYFIWGFNWVIMKEANQFFPPVVFVTYRFALGAIVLLLVNLWLKCSIPPRQYWKWITISGVLQIAANNVAAQIGMQSLGAGFVAILNYSMPLWVALLAHFFLNEKLTKHRIFGIILSMTGLFVLLQVDTYGSVPAILLTLAGAFAWAVSGIIIKAKLQGCNMLQYTTWQMVMGEIFLLIYTGTAAQNDVQWTWAAVGCLLYNGILASAVAFFLWSYILSHMEVGKASISLLAVPVIGVFAGMVFLDETLHWNTAVGMLLILAGIAIVVMQKATDHKKCTVMR